MDIQITTPQLNEIKVVGKTISPSPKWGSVLYTEKKLDPEWVYVYGEDRPCKVLKQERIAEEGYEYWVVETDIYFEEGVEAETLIYAVDILKEAPVLAFHIEREVDVPDGFVCSIHAQGEYSPIRVMGQVVGQVADEPEQIGQTLAFSLYDDLSVIRASGNFKRGQTVKIFENWHKIEQVGENTITITGTVSPPVIALTAEDTPLYSQMIMPETNTSDENTPHQHYIKQFKTSADYPDNPHDHYWGREDTETENISHNHTLPETAIEYTKVNIIRVKDLTIDLRQHDLIEINGIVYEVDSVNDTTDSSVKEIHLFGDVKADIGADIQVKLLSIHEGLPIYLQKWKVQAGVVIPPTSATGEGMKMYQVMFDPENGEEPDVVKLLWWVREPFTRIEYVDDYTFRVHTFPLTSDKYNIFFKDPVFDAFGLQSIKKYGIINIGDDEK